MKWHRPELAGRTRLDHDSEVHHRDDVGDVADDGEVVRDQQQAERQPAREIDQQVRDLRLRRCVERCERLVEHEHRRIGRERACNRDPLPLAAAELMRVASGGCRRKTDELEQLLHAPPAAGSRHQVQHVQRVAQLRADLAPRVERRVRVLEDHLEPGELARARSARERLHLVPLEEDGSRRRSNEANGGARKTRLATAGLADEPDDLSSFDGEARACDRTHAFMAPPFVDDLDVAELERPGRYSPSRNGST